MIPPPDDSMRCMLPAKTPTIAETGPPHRLPGVAVLRCASVTPAEFALPLPLPPSHPRFLAGSSTVNGRPRGGTDHSADTVRLPANGGMGSACGAWWITIYLSVPP